MSDDISTAARRKCIVCEFHGLELLIELFHQIIIDSRTIRFHFMVSICWKKYCIAYIQQVAFIVE